MEIVCVLQAHGEFLVSLCLVVVICHDSFKKVIVVVKVPGCGTWRTVACKSNETDTKRCLLTWVLKSLALHSDQMAM